MAHYCHHEAVRSCPLGFLSQNNNNKVRSLLNYRKDWSWNGKKCSWVEITWLQLSYFKKDIQDSQVHKHALKYILFQTHINLFKIKPKWQVDLTGCKTSLFFISAERVQWEKTYQNPPPKIFKVKLNIVFVY